MHLARRFTQVLTLLAVLWPLAFALSGTADADRAPLLGPGTSMTSLTPSTVTPVNGSILSVDPSVVPCTQTTTFDELQGGASPGVSYDGFISSSGVRFAERFVGQTLSYSGDFDVVTGTPSNPLAVQTGLHDQDLDVFDYSTNVLSGLGHLGYPDIDAIGEGSISMYFPLPQASVSLQVVGGNSGSATLTFYRADGSLIDTVVISGLAEAAYGFATADGKSSITGILIQSTDPSGIGVDNICHEGGVTSTHAVSWGGLKMLYR